jgi:predicted  nucleic acid-binding Zn-ribbon protein
LDEIEHLRSEKDKEKKEFGEERRRLEKIIKGMENRIRDLDEEGKTISEEVRRLEKKLMV